MKASELFEEIGSVRHHARVYQFLVDSLQPFLDQDIGTPQEMEDAGNVVKYVPKDTVEEVREELLDVLDDLAAKLKNLESYEVDPPDPKAVTGKKDTQKKKVAKKITKKRTKNNVGSKTAPAADDQSADLRVSKA